MLRCKYINIKPLLVNTFNFLPSHQIPIHTPQNFGRDETLFASGKGNPCFLLPESLLNGTRGKTLEGVV